MTAEATLRARAALLTLAACALLGGCHLVFPFEAEPDAAAADASRDDDGLDDGPAPDRGPDAAPCRDDAGCVTCEPPVNPLCDEVCAGGDCDSLPDARDPWPLTCNTLVRGYDFSTWIPDWKRIHDGLVIYVKPCGVLEFDVDSHTTMWMRLNTSVAASLPDDALVEVRFLPPVTPGNWWLHLAANSVDSNDPGRVCLLEVDASSKTAALTSMVEGRGPTLGNPFGYGGEGGVLQSYLLDSQHICRFGAHQVSTPITSKPAGGTVEIAAISPQYQPALLFRLDHVRIFSPGP